MATKVKKPIVIKEDRECPDCGGTGNGSDNQPAKCGPCELCSGSGEVAADVIGTREESPGKLKPEFAAKS